MARTLRVGSLAGIALEVHASWLVALALVVASLARALGWVAGALAALAFFACLVVHELAHALVARRVGIAVRSISLFVFGGVARLAAEPRRARDEIAIAAAGPVASLLLGAVAWAASRIAPAPLAATLAWLAGANVALAAFNCLPGLPLDGGRIARAALWALVGDVRRATRIATRLGRAVAWGLVALGGCGFVAGGAPGAAWLVLVGWFLLRGATRSAADAALGAGPTTIADVTRLDFPSVRAPLDLATYVAGVVFPTGERTHLVVDAEGEIGVVTYRAALSVPRRLWKKVRVADVATPLADVPAAAPSMLLGDAGRAFAGAPFVRVVDEGGFAGIVDGGRLRAHARVEVEVELASSSPASSSPAPAPASARGRGRVVVAGAAAAAILALATACRRGDRSDPLRGAPDLLGSEVTTTAASPSGSARASERSEPVDEARLTCATVRDVAESDAVRVVGKRVYYADESTGVTVVDLADDDHPRRVAASPFVGTPLALYVEGSRAWVVFVDWDGPITTVVRALDASSLERVGERRLPGVARDVQLVGDVLYVMREVMREATARTMVSSYVVKKGELVAVQELALDGRPARLAASAAGLAAVTVGDATTITWIDLPLARSGALVAGSSARVAGGFPTWERGVGKTIDVDEDRRVRIVRCATRACAPTDGATLEVIGFGGAGGPSVPTRLGSVEVATRGGVPVTRFAGERLYVAEAGSRGEGDAATTELRVVRTDGEAGRPRVAGRVTLRGAVTALAARDDRVVAIGTAGSPAASDGTTSLAVHDVDVRDAAAPRVRGRATFGSDFTWSPAGDVERAISFDPSASMLALPFMASGADGRYETGAQVVDLTARGPRLGATYGSAGWIERVVFINGRVVAIGRDGVHVIDYVGEDRGP